MNEQRPDPDALLQRLAAEAPRTRGRLKVFFGASPGVGKTYAMLEEARARRAEGADVAIGWIETHGRSETAALTEGVERLAVRELGYRGVRLREFDLDAALARKPGLLLLDELAHTNAPGSRHAKRWQDAEELLEAGINVYTTLNVQHIESLNDLVNQITGVTVRETVPDRLLDAADEVEFVDLPPEELLKRLAEGKVYLAEQAARAAREFFRRGNLLALRELALRRTAEHVDADVQDYRRLHQIDATWPVAGRILVCVRPNPESDRLVRTAWRMASRLRADLIVAYVESPSQPPLTAAERQSLAAIVKLSEELGAETTSLSGEHVDETLLGFARQRNVSHIVVGKPSHARWRDRLRGSLLDDIVRGSGDIEVLVVPGGQTHKPGTTASPAAAPRSGLLRGGYLAAIAVVTACTLVCWSMFQHFDNSNLIMVYLLGVAFVAARHGRAPSALAVLLSVAAFDFFYVRPYMTFAVSDGQYLITFAVMLVVGLLISTLSARVRAQAEGARERERRTHLLYAVTRDLAGARGAGEVAQIATRHMSAVLSGQAEVLLPGPDGTLVSSNESTEPREVAVAQWAFGHGRLAGLGTDTLPGAAAIYVPLRGTAAVVGVLGVRPDPALLPLAPDQLDLLEALARQVASALERVRLAADAEQARVLVETERLRSTLLSSVSHDLRTPLATITGAASSLLSPGTLDARGQRELMEAIYDEAERLNRLVTNLLDMTRLESGALSLHRDWESLEELIGSALSRSKRGLQERAVQVSIPDALPLVPVDAVLIEQCLVNLIDNALKYSEPGSPIEIGARKGEHEIEVTVADVGPGLPAGAEERVFEKFYRGERSGPGGSGLGLPICKAIVVAHGGRIEAANRTPRGACFRFTLPQGDAPPPAPEEEREGG